MGLPLSEGLSALPSRSSVPKSNFPSRSSTGVLPFGTRIPDHPNGEGHAFIPPRSVEKGVTRGRVGESSGPVRRGEGRGQGIGECGAVRNPNSSLRRGQEAPGDGGIRSTGTWTHGLETARKMKSKVPSSACVGNVHASTSRQHSSAYEGEGNVQMESSVVSMSRRRLSGNPTESLPRDHEPESPNLQFEERCIQSGSIGDPNRRGDVNYNPQRRVGRRRGGISETQEDCMNPNTIHSATCNDEDFVENEEVEGEEAAAERTQSFNDHGGGRTGRQLSYVNDAPNDVESDGSDEGGEGRHGEDEDTDRRYEMAIAERFMEETESSKRRERRQAQATREREGQRRRKEGKKRNFLLVDEHTMKPYGVGVGNWRKELMLLSRNLDPAIGNINQQPEGAVMEIADWIQEYSAPVKFSVVKEVVARGVTLRRAELWKMIRNNEDKPEKLSDRSWKILERQMESPATIKKSESCRRANASKVNFGRTGPSGEVGVRERLRRRLRRSPDPEEIRFEMARDKGYGGHLQSLKRKRNVLKEMEGRGPVVTMGRREITERGDAFYDSTEENTEEVNGENEVGGVSGQEQNRVRNGRSIVRGGQAATLSAEEISQHPLVLSLMQRLEALEGRKNAAEVETVSTGEGIIQQMDSERGQGRERSANDGTQEDGGREELEVTGGLRRSGRTKRAKQN